jgi:hypothetical protein
MLEKQFPNFALFTTLLGRVRLSQSVGCKTTSILHFWGFIALSFIPSLNRVRLERGTSR